MWTEANDSIAFHQPTPKMMQCFFWEFDFAKWYCSIPALLLMDQHWAHLPLFWHSNTRAMAVRAHSGIQTKLCVTSLATTSRCLWVCSFFPCPPWGQTPTMSFNLEISMVKYLCLCKCVWAVALWQFGSFPTVRHSLTTQSKRILSYKVCTYRGQTTQHCPACAFGGSTEVPFSLHNRENRTVLSQCCCWWFLSSGNLPDLTFSNSWVRLLSTLTDSCIIHIKPLVLHNNL